MDSEEEPGPIMKEMEEVVSLIRHGRGEILREHIILKVMHDDVVKTVASCRDPEEIA